MGYLREMFATESGTRGVGAAKDAVEIIAVLGTATFFMFGGGFIGERARQEAAVLELEMAKAQAQSALGVDTTLSAEIVDLPGTDVLVMPTLDIRNIGKKDVFLCNGTLSVVPVLEMHESTPILDPDCKDPDATPETRCQTPISESRRVRLLPSSSLRPAETSRLHAPMQVKKGRYYRVEFRADPPHADAGGPSGPCRDADERRIRSIETAPESWVWYAEDVVAHPVRETTSNGDLK